MLSILTFTHLTNFTSIEKIKRVGAEFNSVSAFLAHRFFSKLKLSGTKQVRLFLTDNKDMVHIELPEKGVTPFFISAQFLDFDNYLASSNLEKKKIIWEQMKKAWMLAASEMEWDKTKFNEIFAEVEKLDFQFSSEYFKPVANKKRDKGVLEVIIQPDHNDIYIKIKMHNGETIKRPLLKLNSFYCPITVEIEPNRIISEIRWQDDDTFLVVGKKGHLERILFSYKISSDELSQKFLLDDGVKEKEFAEEFNLATADDETLYQRLLTNEDPYKWHVYL